LNYHINKQLFDLRLGSVIDKRVVACEVKTEQAGDRVRVSGFTMFPQTDTFVRRAAREVFEGRAEFDLKVLCRDSPLAFYEVRAASAPVYRAPSASKLGMISEALYGSVVRGYFKRKGFVYAQHADGYVGYFDSHLLSPVSSEHYLQWKNGPCAVLLHARDVGGVVAPPGARLIMDGKHLRLAGGGIARAPGKGMHIIRAADATFARALIRHARAFQDSPYLWGGKTHRGVDCSGFVQTLFGHERIMLPRDASMQAYAGEIVGYLPGREDLCPGDLIFFMSRNAQITHVGVHAGNDSFMHSSLNDDVSTTSFASSDAAIARLVSLFVFGRRVYMRQ